MVAWRVSSPICERTGIYRLSWAPCSNAVQTNGSVQEQCRQDAGNGMHRSSHQSTTKVSNLFLMTSRLTSLNNVRFLESNQRVEQIGNR